MEHVDDDLLGSGAAWFPGSATLELDGASHPRVAEEQTAIADGPAEFWSTTAGHPPAG